MTSAELLTGRDLTPVQRKILRYIDDYVQELGYSPSYREIACAAELASLSSVALHMRTLQDKGYLSREPRRPRSIVVLPWGAPAVPQEPGPTAAAPAGCTGGPPSRDVPEAAYVPLVGRIAAGQPILSGQPTLSGAAMVSGELAGDGFLLPRQLVGTGTLFMLRVSGDSMIGASIADGDLVVIREQPDAENGDIVAAMIDGLEVEGTVKTLKRSDGHIWLMPHNPVYPPILADDASIVGKVVAVLRRV
jgi:repressor LexA